MASFLVLSHTHSLIPLAYRLHNEGHEVELVVWHKGFAEAWRGKVPAAVKHTSGQLSERDLGRYVAQVERGERVLVTDVEQLRAPFGNARLRYHRLRWPEVPGTGLQVGAWFDGEEIHQPHLLVYDLGPWAGGGGPQTVAGGCTMALPNPETELEGLERLWEPLVGQLKAQDFKGLVRAGLVPSELGGFELQGVDAGWGWLNHQAFISELDGLGDMLANQTLPNLDHWRHKYVTVVPVSIPPWPTPAPSGRLRAAAQPVSGLSPEQAGRLFWYDLAVDEALGSIGTAGLDGLVAVARGSGHTPETARARALEVALRLQVDGKQLRPDVGAKVPAAVAGLETGLGLLL